MVQKVVFLVDGFNVYHSLKQLEQASGQKVRWLDLTRLLDGTLSTIRHRVGDRVDRERVVYYSALATHLTPGDPGVVQRHEAYIAALEASEVRVVLSRFKMKDVRCPNCRTYFRRYEEKETDVAIALGIVEAFTGGADAVVLVSGDSDLTPAIRSARRLFPQRKIGVAFPYHRRASELEQAADFAFNLRPAEIQRAQLPDPVRLRDGTAIAKPANW